MLKPPQAREPLLEGIGVGACVLATLLAVCLHVVFLTHAGALWRDEASVIQLVRSDDPSLRAWLTHDFTFPAFFWGLLRTWSALGIGGSDFALRVLGFLVGLALLGGIWLNARWMGFRPFISLGLLAANLALVRWGDSLRAYGCGSLFILLTLGLVWRLLQRPARSTFLLASAAAVLSVQTLYHNAFLVLAACVAGCLVCLRHRRWNTALPVLGVGLLAAASLVPYMPALIRTQQSSALFKMGFELDRVWDTLLFALGSGLKWPAAGWFGVAAVVLGVGWTVLLAPAKKGPLSANTVPCPQPTVHSPLTPGCGLSAVDSGLRTVDCGLDTSLFAVAALVAGVVCFFAFLRLSEFPVQPWYYLPLMVFAAGAMDAALKDWCRFRLWPSLFIIAMVCMPFPSVWRSAHARQTNVDLIAAELEQRAQPGDLILVSPFFLGITFDRYYKGPMAWTTLPPIADQRFHRIDLLIQGLCSKPLLHSVLNRMTNALASGHAIWLVGDWPPPQPGEAVPPELPDPAVPGQPFGWEQSRLCAHAWERQTVFLIGTRAEQAARIPVQPAVPISEVENARLIRVAGWRPGP